MRRGELGFQADGLVKVLDGPVIFHHGLSNEAPRIETGGVLWFQPNALVEVANGLVGLSAKKRGAAAHIKRPNILRVGRKSAVK